MRTKTALTVDGLIIESEGDKVVLRLQYAGCIWKVAKIDRSFVNSLNMTFLEGEMSCHIYKPGEERMYLHVGDKSIVFDDTLTFFFPDHLWRYLRNQLKVLVNSNL